MNYLKLIELKSHNSYIKATKIIFKPKLNEQKRLLL